MFKKLYIGAGAVMIGGYLIWSLAGWEWGSRRDPVPRAVPVRYSSGGRTYYGHSSRSSGGYYRSSSGFGGWGK